MEFFSADSDLAPVCKMIIYKEYSPIRPFLMFSDYCPGDILGIIADLHIRILLFSMMLIILVRLIGLIISIFDTLLYKGWLLDYKWLSMYPCVVDKAKAFIDCLTTSWKKLLLNYWNYVFDFNENLEILMVDIMTRSDELYSGKFVDWVPHIGNQNSQVAIGITEILKYDPEKNFHKNNTDTPKRRWRLIKNKGAMYIPFSEISSMHTWKILRGTSFTIWIDDENKKERLKWYLLIVAKRSHFIKKIEINIDIGGEEEAELYCISLLSWIEENNLEKITDKIYIEILLSKDASGVESTSVNNS